MKTGTMEITLLKSLLKIISSFLHLSKDESMSLNVVHKYYQKAGETLKLLKPILDAIVDSEIASHELLNKMFQELHQYVEELKELFENYRSLSSTVYFVLQIESLISKIRSSSLDIFQLLNSSREHLPDELSSSSLEHCVQKIKHMGYEHISSLIKLSIRDQAEGVEPNLETLVKVSESLSLRSNQEILIEAVALEKLKENAEQAEKADEAEFIDQIITLVTCMHEHLVLSKQTQTPSPVPIPPDFCCPLSLELMTDPVIVASGQTYERAFIKNWIELGLTVCPKTRQTLVHTNLIPNYTVKALIVNWCESNNVKLPDPMKSVTSTQKLPVLVHSDSDSPKEPLAFSHSRTNQSVSPESVKSTGSPVKSFISSSETRLEGTSPLHPRSVSEGSLPGVVGNGLGLDIGRMSLAGNDETYAVSEEQNMDSVGYSNASPSRREVLNALRPAEALSRNHNRSASASTVLANAAPPQQASRDSDESLELPNHIASYSSDTSGEVKAESHASSASNIPNREPDFSPRFVDSRSRNQTIWRRPTDRLVPRIVSSSSLETRADLTALEAQVRKLFEDLKSPSIDVQRDATSEIRLLAKHSMDNRIVIANSGAITLLVDLLRSTDSKIQENAVTALLNLSINDNNKTAIANANAIEPLIHVLETGSPEAKENSAATLFSLSVLEENKVRIGRSGAIVPLVDLLGNGTPRGKKDASTALFNLSIFHENKTRIVQAGAIKHLVELMDPAAGMVDKAVAVLANLATIPEGRNAIGQLGGIPVLVEVVELGSARGKENAAAALLQLCISSNRFCHMVLQEGAVPPLVALSQSGTPRAKEKAQALLSHFRSQRHGGGGRN